MDAKLNYLEARIVLHASRVPTLIDLGAPPVIIGQEMQVLSALCAEYTLEYLATITAFHALRRYCKVVK